MLDIISYPGNNKIKTTMRYHITHTKMVIIQKTETYEKKNVVKLELSYIAG